MSIRGSVIGDLHASGRIIGGSLGTVKINGSILGGDGDLSGQIFSVGAVGAVTIRGDIRGSDGPESGKVDVGGAIKSLTVRGSVIGGGAGGNYDTSARRTTARSSPAAKSAPSGSAVRSWAAPIQTRPTPHRSEDTAAPSSDTPASAW